MLRSRMVPYLSATEPPCWIEGPTSSRWYTHPWTTTPSGPRLFQSCRSASGLHIRECTYLSDDIRYQQIGNLLNNILLSHQPNPYLKPSNTYLNKFIQGTRSILRSQSRSKSSDRFQIPLQRCSCWYFR
jgi:hypothetical protein